MRKGEKEEKKQKRQLVSSWILASAQGHLRTNHTFNVLPWKTEDQEDKTIQQYSQMSRILQEEYFIVPSTLAHSRIHADPKTSYDTTAEEQQP